MATEIVVPDLGESIVEATVLRWLKQEGEPVAAGETLVELETEKVNLEVSAPYAGVLARIERPAGQDVKIGDVLGVVEETRVAPPPRGGEPPSAQPRETPAAKVETPREAQPAPGPRATPVAERMAAEYGVDLSKVGASGAEQRITKQDVQEYLEKQKPQPAAPAAEKQTQAPPAARPPAAPPPLAPLDGSRGEERVRMSRRRQTIARRLLEAKQSTAMLTTFNEIDMSAVMTLRKERREAFQERYGVSLGLMSFFVKASIGALKAFPRLNAEIQGDEIILKHYYDIGIAVGAEEGLVVPVLRDADRLTFAGIERAIAEFAKKAEAGTLSIEDLRGGTFTLSNGGVYGSLLSTPILNPPQVGILGLHKIEERPIALNGQVVIRPMMYVALSYDHRIVDGREAVQFLVRVKQLIQDPTALLLEG